MKPKFLHVFSKKRNEPPDAPHVLGADRVVVIVPGVIESILLLDKGTEKERPFYSDALRYVRRHAGGFLAGTAEALLFRRYGMLRAFGEGMSDAAFGSLYMRPDGSTIHELRTVIETPEESAYRAICSAGKWKSVGYGARMAMEIAPRIGGDNVFVFCYDWRRGVVRVAEDLRGFIEGVKELTGGREISFLGCSYGCQVISQYLYAGGKDASRIVFNAPAWQGTALFRQLYETDRSKFFFNVPAAARVLTRFAGWETDLEPYTKLVPHRISDELAFSMVRRALEGGLMYCPGLWSCCASGDYGEMKHALPDPENSAPLTAETDAAHYGVMRRIPEILEQAQKDGVGVWCMMNDGTPLMTGRGFDGDGVIDVTSGSGGVSLPEGRTAEAGPGRRLSPSGRYDLTDALLPDRTWVIRGQVHGQSWWDDASRSLIADLLLTGTPATVHDDPERPQFMESRCPACGVSLRLGAGADFILDLSKGEIRGTVRNDSRRKHVIVLSVTARGLPCRTVAGRGLLRPGGELPVALIPERDTGSSAFGEVAVRYIKSDPLPLVHKRVFAVRTNAF